MQPDTLSPMDSAVLAHMGHDAMPVGDVLAQSLYAQLEAPAAEGGTAHGPAPAPLTPQQLAQLHDMATLGDWPLWLVAGIAAVALAAHTVALLLHGASGAA